MSAKKGKAKFLSEKIAECFVPRPLRDPELDSEDESAVKIAEVDDEDYEFNANEGLSDIRKRNIKFLSEYSDKYHGEVSSRKELEKSENVTSDESDGNQSEKDVDDDLEEYRKRLKNYQIDSEPDEFLGTDEEVEEDHIPSEAETEQDDSDYDSSASGDEKFEQSDAEDVDAELIKDEDRTAEIEKGLSVQNQLKIWEKLLEVRIQSQKMLLNANSLPQPDAFNTFCENNKDFLKLAQEAQQNVSGLLGKMIEMQQLLLKQYPETKQLSSSSSIKRKRSDDKEDRPTKKFATELNDNFENFRTYRNSVLQKWHDRTKILTPGASNKGKSNSFDIVKKIEAVLFNKNDLIKKSQIVKGNYNIFGNKPEKNEENYEEKNDDDKEKDKSISSPEIYDDSDFYHQQLRELIEFKTSTLENPADMSRQLAELQKLRHKMKKKVDTRASKGRKIRYVTHNKLVNFMAPNDNSSWTEESKNELYRSLFAT